MDTLDEALTDEVVRSSGAALPVLLDLTKLLRQQAATTRELIGCLDHLQVGLRGGYDRPAHWTLAGAVERGWHDDVWNI